MFPKRYIQICDLQLYLHKIISIDMEYLHIMEANMSVLQ